MTITTVITGTGITTTAGTTGTMAITVTTAIMGIMVMATTIELTGASGALV